MEFYIFTEKTSDFQTFVGGQVNNSLELCNIAPLFKQAFYEHVCAWVCEELWEELITQYKSDKLSEWNEKLLPLMQQTIAWYTLFEYSFVGEIQVSDSGFHRVESEKHKSAYKYQTNNARFRYLKFACQCKERMLLHLDKYAARYPLWSKSDCRDEVRCLFINWTKDFNRYYTGKADRCTYECLRPIMKMIECFLLDECFGEKFINYLRDLNREKPKNLRACDKKLLDLIKFSIVNLSIQDALVRGMVQISPIGTVQSTFGSTENYVKEAPAERMTVKYVVSHYKQWGEDLWTKVKEHLDNNADKYPLYEDFCAQMCACTCSYECEEEIIYEPEAIKGNRGFLSL